MTCGIDYLAIIFRVIVLDTPLKRSFDGGIVVFDELALKVLEDEGRLACT